MHDRKSLPAAGFGRFPRTAAGAALAGALAILALPAAAATTWTDWSSRSPGNPGSATGTLDGVSVSYSGQVIGNAVVNGSSTLWSPDSTFMGGTVTTSPSTMGDIITLNGNNSGLTNTITFGSPVVDPVFSIWSLGSPGRAASFTFNETPTLEAGGPNAQFGGSSITVSGNTVSGKEGNGVVQFTGTFSSLSWTNAPEHFYGFSVGTNGGISGGGEGGGATPPPPPIPEPSTSALLAVGLVAGLGFLNRRRQTGADLRLGFGNALGAA